MTKNIFDYFTENEIEIYNKFCKKHSKKHWKYQTAIGGRYTIIITPTSIGERISIRCNVCRKEKIMRDLS